MGSRQFRLEIRKSARESVPLPWMRYLISVGGTLICLLFVADAYLPKASPKPYHEIDRTILRIHGDAGQQP